MYKDSCSISDYVILCCVSVSISKHITEARVHDTQSRRKCQRISTLSPGCKESLHSDLALLKERCSANAFRSTGLNRRWNWFASVHACSLPVHRQRVLQFTGEPWWSSHQLNKKYLQHRRQQQQQQHPQYRQHQHHHHQHQQQQQHHHLAGRRHGYDRFSTAAAGAATVDGGNLARP